MGTLSQRYNEEFLNRAEERKKTDRRPQNRRPRRPHSQPAVSNAPELLLRVSRSSRLPFGDFTGTGADGSAGREAGRSRPPENAL